MLLVTGFFLSNYLEKSLLILGSFHVQNLRLKSFSRVQHMHQSSMHAPGCNWANTTALQFSQKKAMRQPCFHPASLAHLSPQQFPKSPPPMFLLIKVIKKFPEHRGGSREEMHFSEHIRNCKFTNTLLLGQPD